MTEKRKSITPPKRASRANVPAVRAPFAGLGPARKDREPPLDHATLLARLAHAEEELGQMLVRATRAETRAREAEARLHDSASARVTALTAECDALKDAMREAATVLLRALRPGPRVAPPPLPSLSPPSVDISEIAEMVESLRPPPHRT